MPQAVTHVLLAIILADLYRDYVTKHKKYFTMHTIMIAGIAGLLPDIDIPLAWLLSAVTQGPIPQIITHGGVLHTPLFGLVFLLPAIYLWEKKKHKQAVYFLAVSFGILFHIFLDYLLGGGHHDGIMFFWPLSTAQFKIHLLSQLGLDAVPAALDALILLAWLWHEEMKHKIKDFI